MCSSLFYTVATRVCLNKIRSEKLRSGPQIDNLLTEIADNATANHEEVTNASMLLDQIFATSKPDTREMAILHYLDGYTLEETAKKMIQFLKKNKGGRATFLPLTSIKNPQEFKTPEVLDEKGVIGMADALVTIEKKYKDDKMNEEYQLTGLR